MIDIKLGLIGDHIAASSAPALHRLAGELCGLSVSYELLVPRDRAQDFDSVFAGCARDGYDGVNVTYPYKERAASKVSVDDPLIAALGAINSVVFAPQSALGFNTDYSGFVRGYQFVMGDIAAGTVCMVGAGGAGKAVGFGLLELGLQELRIVEQDLAKAHALSKALQSIRPGLVVSVNRDVTAAAADADGIVNCTPVGMVGHAGTPMPRSLMRGARWALDVVYTPLETQFLRDAAAEGLKTVSGYELFFYQGVHAFEIFSGCGVDEAALRRGLSSRNT